MMQCCHIMQPLPRGSFQHPHRRLPHLLFLLFLYSLTSCSNGITAPTKKESVVPLLGAIPDTPFRCLGHSAGYYADPDTGCQVYHMCDSLERQYSYLCPNYTLFNQKFMVCDHWYMVDCATSQTFYHLNSHIGEVPEKGEREEEQNAITEGPLEDVPPRKGKGSPASTSHSASSSPRRLPQPSTRPSKAARGPQSAFQHSETQPVKSTVFRTPTNPVTPSTRFALTTSTIKPNTSPQRQFAPSVTAQPNTPPSFVPPTIKPQQSLTPPARQPVIPPRQPVIPPRQPEIPSRQPVIPSRQPEIPPRQPAIPSRQPVIPSRQPEIPSRQPEIPSRQPVIPPRQPAIPSRQPVIPSRQPEIPSRQPEIPSRQPVIPSRQPVIPPKQPVTSTTRPPPTSTRASFFSFWQPTTPTRQPFISPARQSSVATTSKPVTSPIRQTVTQPPRQTVTQPTRETVTGPTRQTVTGPTRQTVTQPTRETVTEPTRETVTEPTRQTVTQPTRETVTGPTRQTVTQPTLHRFSTTVPFTTPETQEPPSSLSTPQRTQFRSHNRHTFIGNKQENNTVRPNTHTFNINPSLSSQNNLSPQNAARTHRVHKEDPSGQTKQPSTDLNMMPASVARSPGNRFSFTSHREEEVALTPEELQRIVFQPLLTPQRTKTRRILTSAPSLLPIDPANSSDPHHHHFPMRIEFPSPVIPEDSSSRSSLDLKLSTSHGLQAPTLTLEPPSVSAALDPLASFLSPPTHPFTPITGMKQEFPTPLAVPQRNDNLRTSPRDTFLPGARRLPFPPSTRGNRDFFIPSAEFPEFSLLVPELPQNIVEETAHDHSHGDGDHHHGHHGDHMTMVFPAPIGPSKMEELKLNPECPRCHPEFLKPGQCHPCVVIK